MTSRDLEVFESKCNQTIPFLLTWFFLFYFFRCHFGSCCASLYLDDVLDRV